MAVNDGTRKEEMERKKKVKTNTLAPSWILLLHLGSALSIQRDLLSPHENTAKGASSKQVLLGRLVLRLLSLWDCKHNFVYVTCTCLKRDLFSNCG